MGELDEAQPKRTTEVPVPGDGDDDAGAAGPGRPSMAYFEELAAALLEDSGIDPDSTSKREFVALRAESVGGGDPVDGRTAAQRLAAYSASADAASTVGNHGVSASGVDTSAVAANVRRLLDGGGEPETSLGGLPGAAPSSYDENSSLSSLTGMDRNDLAAVAGGGEQSPYDGAPAAVFRSDTDQLPVLDENS